MFIIYITDRKTQYLYGGYIQGRLILEPQCSQKEEGKKKGKKVIWELEGELLGQKQD